MVKRAYSDLPNSPFKELDWGFIYLIHLGNNYKIGTTVNLRTRIKSIDKELARLGKDSVVVDHYFISKDAYKTEREFHKYFDDKRSISATKEEGRFTRRRSRGIPPSEWFSLSLEEVEYIKSFSDEV